MTKPKTPPTVHNYSTYQNHKCRCDVCKAANAAYQKRRGAERRAGIVGRGGQVGPRVHNANTYINWGCRCEVCTSDATRGHAEWQRAYWKAIRELISRHPDEFQELRLAQKASQ